MKNDRIEVPPSLSPLIPLFLQTMLSEQKKLLRAVGSYDFERLASLCHANKGAAAIYGFHDLGQKLQDLENAASRANRMQAYLLVQEISSYITYIYDKEMKNDL